jgi:hypothetical protein
MLMPVGAYAGTLQLLLPYLAYKFPNIRSYLIFAAQMGTVIASLLLWLLPSSAQGGLLFACIILPSVGAGYAVLMGLQLANIAGYTKRSIASSGLYIGYCLGEYSISLLYCLHVTDYSLQAISLAPWFSNRRMLLVMYQALLSW